MFDAGAVPDSHFKGDAPVTEGIMSATKPLLPQLAAAGYTPAEITYFAMSHYHSDHTANANEFAGATWIVQKAERDSCSPTSRRASSSRHTYSALKNAKTRILNNEDFDVFGDGTVVIKSTPGHTPGHQVLFVRLPKTGPVVLAGDLYHYPEERTTGRVPTFEFNADQSRPHARRSRPSSSRPAPSSGSSTTSPRTRAAEGARVRRVAADLSSARATDRRLLPLLTEVQHLVLLDVRVVFLQRLGEHVRAVVAADEVEIRHVRWRERRLERRPARVTRSGRAAGPEYCRCCTASRS